MWNVIDFVTNSLYVATVALRVVSYFQVYCKLHWELYAFLFCFSFSLSRFKLWHDRNNAIWNVECHFRRFICKSICLLYCRYKKKWCTIKMQRICHVNSGIHGIRCCYQVGYFPFYIQGFIGSTYWKVSIVTIQKLSTREHLFNLHFFSLLTFVSTSEGLFSAANIFSSLKLVYIFSVNPHLGPLQVSLSRMVMDIMKFFFLYVLVLFAFSSGLNQLLW